MSISEDVCKQLCVETSLSRKPSVLSHLAKLCVLTFKKLFWLHYAACGILVPQSEIKPMPFALEVLSQAPVTSTISAPLRSTHLQPKKTFQIFSPLRLA